MQASTAAPQAVIIDVRSPAEFEGGHVDGAINLPLDRFVDGYARVAPDKQQLVVLYCASGARSEQAVQYLAAQGYGQVVNGISARNVAAQLGKAVV
jgi:phage shock protein E